jgi:nitroreductase
MDIPFSRWYPAIEKRRSHRLFDAGQPVQPDKIAALEKVCREFVPFPGVRSCLVAGGTKDIFRGIVGSYGKIKDAPAFIAFIGNMADPFIQEKLGYTGEGVILEGTALGLATCWVGGFFRPESVASLIELKASEQVLCVTPVGYARRLESLEEKMMAAFGRHHRRVPVARLMSERSSYSLSDWIKASIKAARLAPSAVNRQPWGFDVEDGGITVYVRTGGPEFSISKRLDCGIAMLHIEVAAGNFGIKGEWQFLKAPRVARFTFSAVANNNICTK